MKPVEIDFILMLWIGIIASIVLMGFLIIFVIGAIFDIGFILVLCTIAMMILVWQFWGFTKQRIKNIEELKKK